MATLPTHGDKLREATIALAGARTLVGVPMVKNDEVIGAITIYRQEVKPFADKQTEVVANFANQAVIAIENARLLRELRERTDDLSESLEQQTATSEVLETISSSPGELGPVFTKMLENATRVCGANFGTMNLWDGEKYSIVAVHNIPPAFAEYRQRAPIVPHPGSSLATVVETHQPVQVPDLKDSPGYKAGVANVVGLADVAGARTILVVPMLKDDELLGAITIIRQEVKPFTDKQVALVENFTKQAVIAIENTRLLNALKDRTEELSRSLDDLRTAQDRLVQTEKLASLGQLTAGIAHEIKNPLNFVNNFAGLSIELLDELKQAAAPVLAGMNEDARAEFGDTVDLITANLGKIAEHGKRADGIVKSMLAHSRGGTGDWQVSNINALVEEALNLAYHGARAQDQDLNVTLERDFAETRPIEVVPQDVTRVFLNLFGNGFYAAKKRQLSGAGSDYRPTLAVSTRDLGEAVEIRVRDNGTGIPAEVREKLFQPFFTTKPTGEGTGLGLSISYDIVTQQHGGSIDVESELGSFTEFTVSLPRRRRAA